MPSPTDTNYTARFELPHLIERATDNVLKCPVYLNGALAAPSTVYEESATADLEWLAPTYEAVERSTAEPDDTVTVSADGSLTIDEAIGRARLRARPVRHYRDSHGNPQRTTQPGPWRGPEPTQRTFHPDARIDDA